MNKIAAPSKLSKHVIGFFDHIHDGHAYGWAFNQNSPGERVTIDIYCDGNLVGQSIANEFRKDLLDAGIGDGYYSFRIPISYELSNGKEYKLLARDTNSLAPLEGSPQAFGPHMLTREFDLIARSEGLDYLLKFINSKIQKVSQSKIDSYIKVFDLASMLQETGKTHDARHAWESFEKALGNNALFPFKIAETFMLEGQYESALKFYMKAASEDLKWFWPHLGIGGAYRSMKKYAESFSAVDVARSLKPVDTTIIARLGELKSIIAPGPADESLHTKKYPQLVSLLFSTTAGVKPTARKSNSISARKKSTISSSHHLDEFIDKLEALKNTINHIDELKGKNH